MKRLVIADDLTGANDTGVHFLSETENVEVVIDSAAFSLQELDHSVDTIVINTGTRNAAPQEAAQKVKEYVEQFLIYAPNEIYKKIDSTLRGNVGAEIDALMQASGYSLACVAPAVPRNGRTTVDGICYVNGIPLDKTEFAQDPFSPVASSNASAIITAQSTRRTAVLTLNTLRAPREQALRALTSLAEDGYEIIVVDSETREDLLLAKELFTLLPLKVLFVGAAGFFHAVGTEIHRHSIKPHSSVPKILFVTGSMMETSKKQCDYLVHEGYLDKTFPVISKQAICDESAEIARVVQAVSGELRKSQIALIHTDRDSHEIAHTAHKVGSTVSRIVREVLQTTHVDALVVTGGETAMNVLSELRVKSLRLIDEALPAVPVSLMKCPENGEILFISKAGSYGNTDVLEGIIRYVKDMDKTNREQENE
ncbi:MAG: four-carbon acid sugar kinase family protein [Sphaerochaetaceae bacterium]|nr:four-carbon acid sugar kinase family protein [Sphaerochaetaceae bacterium]